MAENAIAEPSFREQVEQAEQTTAPAEPVAPAAEPVEVDPQTEVAADLQPVEEGKPEVKKVVPLSALHDERRKRQDLQRQYEDQQRQMEQMRQQQLAILAEMQRRSMPAPPPPPDENADPLGAGLHLAKQTQAQLAALQQNIYTQQQRAAQENAVINFQNTVATAEEMHAREVPDSREAVAFLRQRKAQEYIAAGMPEAQAWQRVNNDGWQLAQYCLERGENPAAAAYRMATALGYTPKANASKKLEMQQAGQKASLPSGGSGQGGGRVSLDALSKMDGKDFLKATSGDNWKKLVGGL